MQHFNFDDDDIQIDTTSSTITICVRPKLADYDEVELLFAGWATIESLRIQRLVVIVDAVANRFSLRN